jgi:ELWxxDGT repeat protein
MPAKYPRLAVALALAVSLTVAAPASALQPPDFRIVNLSPGSDGSNAAHFTRFGAWDYFSATEGTTAGLWRTNGTTTELVSDQVTVESAFNYYGSTDTTFAVLGSYLYFAGDTGASGSELWRTDGVTTELVKEINPGGADGVVPNFKKLGSYLYFGGRNATQGWELWRTNGTTTALVKDIEPGAGDSYPNEFIEFGGKLYYSVSTTAAGWELGRTDGTSAGTVVYDITSGSDGSVPQDLTIFQSRLYFSGPGAALWYTSGTGDPVEFPYSPVTAHSLTVMGSQLFFTGSDSDHGRELWVTTGDITDAAGTAMVKDIQDGSSGSEPKYLTVLGSRIYFSADTPEFGRELWSSNGLINGTTLVRDLNENSTGPLGVSSYPKSLTVFAGSIYLYAESTDGPLLWRVDSSTSASPQSAIPLPYAGVYTESYQRRLYPSGDKLYVQTDAAGAGQEYAWMQAPAAPASVTAPAITGTAKVGKVLTGARGSWSGVPSAITSAQWYRCTSAGTTTPTSTSLSGCAAISGATKATYKAVTADKGKYLRLRVKAQNESGTVYRWSKATVKILP